MQAVGYTRRESYKRHLRSMAASLGIADRMVMAEYAGDTGDIRKNLPLARRLGQNASDRYEKFYRPATMLGAIEQHFAIMANRI